VSSDKKLLFLVNGLGLGNSTRCEALIRELLDEGYSISVATSGNGLRYFENCGLDIQIIKLSQHEDGKTRQGELSVLKTILKLPRMGLVFLKNLKALIPYIKNKKLVGVFFDSEYSILPLKPLCNAPVIGINNANIVIRYILNNGPVPWCLYPQLMIEIMDKIYYRVAADHIICPSLSRETIFDKKITYCPPLIRKSLETKCGGDHKVQNGLIMLSGSQFKTDLGFLENKELKHINWEMIGQVQEIQGINSNGKIYCNEKKIADADLMIINAGFSAVSEAAVLGIPSLVLPIKNHAEQFANAKMYEELQLGVCAIENQEGACLQSLIKNYKYHVSTRRLPNGVDVATKKIKEIIESYD